MENRIISTSAMEFATTREAMGHDATVFLAQMDGRKVVTEADFYRIASDIFHFPRPAKIMDGFLDWITDLTWLEVDAFVWVIDHYADFMRQDRARGDRIIGAIARSVLPWWRSDVERFCVGGAAKRFDVYLAD